MNSSAPDPSPLLQDTTAGNRQSTTTTTLAELISPSGSSRRGGGRNRERSVTVRNEARRQLEERRADWGYSTPVVALDVTWNLVFVAVAVAVLSTSTAEKTESPIRIWICGYGFQCLVHVGLVWSEYRRRQRQRRNGSRRGGSSDGSGSEGDEGDNVDEGGSDSQQSSIIKRCESINTMASFLWWIVGFYWVVSGGETLVNDAPRLYWLTVIFLAFDVLFAIFCVALACLIGIALCCCLPCIIAILYAVAGQEGASEVEISMLPRYRYRQACDPDAKDKWDQGSMIAVSAGGGEVTDERAVSNEDAECCICLQPYEDGVELQLLPCNHHYHTACIVKWLRLNATCPLCKYNILKGNEQV